MKYTCILNVLPSHSEKTAHLRVWTDAGELLVESEELDKFRGELGLFCNLCNKVIWTGGKFQGSFFGVENIKLLFVFQDSNVWITCKRSMKYSKLKDKGCSSYCIPSNRIYRLRKI